MWESILGTASLPTIAGLQFMLIVALSLLAIISLLLIIAFQQHDPGFVRNGGLLGLAFRAIAGRSPSMPEQAIILAPIALIIVIVFCL